MQDVLKPLVPLFFKTVVIRDEANQDIEYLEMQDLLGKFTNPCVMDIKMVSSPSNGMAPSSFIHFDLRGFVLSKSLKLQRQSEEWIS